MRLPIARPNTEAFPGRTKSRVPPSQAKMIAPVAPLVYIHMRILIKRPQLLGSIPAPESPNKCNY